MTKNGRRKRVGSPHRATWPGCLPRHDLPLLRPRRVLHAVLHVADQRWWLPTTVPRLSIFQHNTLHCTGVLGNKGSLYQMLAYDYELKLKIYKRNVVREGKRFECSTTVIAYGYTDHLPGAMQITKHLKIITFRLTVY